MATPFLGEIRPVGFNFAPAGWALCNGQLLSISQNTALFSLLGTYYGGDGKSNFALPNLQGGVPVGMGQGVGLSPYNIGQTAGSSSVALDVEEIPQHTHLALTNTAAASEYSPVGNVPAQAAREVYSDTVASSSTLALPAVQVSGGGLPHNNMQPYLAVTYIIALTGIYPSRS